MRFSKLFRLSIVAALFVAPSFGDIIGDPQMGIDADGLSDPLTGNTTFSPVNGGGIFRFYNGTGQLIVGLIFDTTIRTGLSQDTIARAFNCNSAGTSALPNPFFLDCSVGYASQDGLLTISFFGVNPLDQPLTNSLVDLHEGIPPVPSGCLSNPDATGCTGVGHFLITLNNEFEVEDEEASGGWSPDRNPGLFDSTPQFGVAAIQTAVPEPAPVALLGGALAAIGLLRWRKRRL